MKTLSKEPLKLGKMLRKEHPLFIAKLHKQ
jgi:hypothetical protein